MHHAFRTSAAFAAAALLGALAAPAQYGRPADPPAGQSKPNPAAERAKPARPAAGQPATPAQPAQPARDRGAEGRDKAGDARGARGKSAEAREAAPGQDPDNRGKDRDAKRNESSAQDEPKLRELRETRAKRQKERRDALKQRFGLDRLQRPPVAAELKTHAWRMARLERVRALAEAMADAGKRKKTLERVDKLIEKEKARHARQMEQLSSQPGTMAAGASPPGAGKPEASGKPPGVGRPDHASQPPVHAPGVENRPEKAGGAR